MKIKQIIANGILGIAQRTAKISCNSASVFGFYQPKEPENLALRVARIKAQTKTTK